MHIVFVHRNFPAQFGHIAARLSKKYGYQTTFVTESTLPRHRDIEIIGYKCTGGATASNHPTSRCFENYTWHNHAVLEALKSRPYIRPDVVVGHSGFGSTLLLRDFYCCPIVNLCEWFYCQEGSDTEFFNSHFQGSELRPPTDRSRNATLLADLDACTLGYSPTKWQRSRIPLEYQHKLQTTFDGIDTTFWRQMKINELGFIRRVAGRRLPWRRKIITYVSRGFESIRGFDVFMQIAKRICEKRRDVVFLCIGSDRVCYGSDMRYIKEKSFREHIIKNGRFDLDRFIFTGQIPPAELRRALSYSDLHIYLTAPFVLSWSLMDALSCGCNVLVADTPPLREVIEHGHNGFMAPYYDVDHFVELALDVLEDPAAYRRSIGARALETIQQRYSLDVVLPKMIRLYEWAINGDVPKPGSVDVVSNAGEALRDSQSERISHVSLGDPDLRNRPRVSLRDLELQSGWLSKDEHASLKKMIPATATRILELGAWRGQTTLCLADHCPDAEIVAVDTWHGGVIRSDEHPDWKSMLPLAWEAFSARVSHLRDRVTPIRRNHDDAVRELAEANSPFDVIYYDPDYNSKLVRETLRAILRHYPSTLFIGHDWYWHGVRDQLARLAQRTGRPLVARGNLWRLEPAMASHSQMHVGDSSRPRRSQPANGNGSTPLLIKQQRPRVLLAIPHYYRQDASRFYGSSTDSRQQRVVALRSCLSSYLQTFSGSAFTACLAHPDNQPANTATKADLQIVVCVHEDDHVLADVALPTRHCEVRQIEGNPLFLGYTCHEVLRDRLGNFDYFVYSEDDLVLTDSWTLAKLRWFASIAPENSLLQANRYEVANDGTGRKAYIDGSLESDKTARYQDVTDHPVVAGDSLGSRIRFRRTLNPHAGCFFLTSEQMRHWSEQPYFLDRDASFYSPLEGAATVGVMRTFRTYKPSAENANFFEIRHMGDAMMRRIAARDEAVLAKSNGSVSRRPEFTEVAL